MNQQEHNINKKKVNILILIFINIYEYLSLSFTDYQYFLKIVNNHLQKI